MGASGGAAQEPQLLQQQPEPQQVCALSAHILRITNFLFIFLLAKKNGRKLLQCLFDIVLVIIVLYQKRSC